MTRSELPVDGILFDKDGTLFEFRATWDTWGRAVLADLSAGDAALRGEMATAIGYDEPNSAFRSDSIVIAGTNREVSEKLFGLRPDLSLEDVEQRLINAASAVDVVAPVPLRPLLGVLRDAGLVLGVMTNDAEDAAHAHLGKSGVAAYFDFIAGFDSGYGAKPSPDPLLAFCTQFQLTPERAVMVGDSTHDLMAGRAAGMTTVGVLTGTAPREVLAPFADHVFDHIGALPGWLGIGAR